MKKPKIILIMGLPGAGKTTLASELVPIINAKWLNADQVRKEANDWDFSEEGRKRQADRMRIYALNFLNKGFNVVADFVCPTPEARDSFNPDYIIWVNTISKSRFEDTNKLFVKPKKFDIEIKTKNSKFWVKEIVDKVLSDLI
jgi:adenylylsulfate kinase